MLKKMKTKIPFKSERNPRIEISANVFCSEEGKPRFATIFEIHNSHRGLMKGIFIGSIPEKFRKKYALGWQRASEKEIRKIAKITKDCIYIEVGKKFNCSHIENIVGELEWEEIQ